MSIWEEDPRWQQAQYKILVWGVGVCGVLAIFVSALIFLPGGVASLLKAKRFR